MCGIKELPDIVLVGKTFSKWVKSEAATVRDSLHTHSAFYALYACLALYLDRCHGAPNQLLM
jgi:hypothetical protein